MPRSNIRVTAARYALGILASDALARAAGEAIDDGIYTPDLADVAASSQPTMSDIGPLFEKALAELRIPLPPPDEAVRVIVRDLILRIADGRMAPRTGVAELYKLRYATLSIWESEGVVGERFCIEGLAGSHFAYDELEDPAGMCTFNGLAGREGVLALDAELIRLSVNWLADHPSDGRSEEAD